MMWQRFTEQARKVVFFAQEETQKFGEGYVSTEHLLLGLVREQDTLAIRVLQKFNVSPEKIRVEIERALPRGEHVRNREMTLTPRAKRVVDIAHDEARNLSNTYIGTEHLLLALIREGDGLAGRTLAKLGIELEQARNEVRLFQDSDPKPYRAGGKLEDEDPPTAFPRFKLSNIANRVVKKAEDFVIHYEGNRREILPYHLAYVIFSDPSLSLLAVLEPLDCDPRELATQIREMANLSEAAVVKTTEWSDELAKVLVLASSLRMPADTLALVLALWESDDQLSTIFEKGLKTDLPAFRLRVQAFWDANPTF